MKSIPGLECIDENGAGINYEGDETDNNDNKSSLHDYHIYPF